MEGMNQMNIKAFSFSALAALASAAYAGTVEVVSEPIGIIKVGVEAGADAPVGVPYLGGDGNAVTVADLVKVGLTTGDEISVWDGSTYRVWRYDGSSWVGAADANKGVAATTDDATATTLQPGQAVWFKPSSATSGTVTFAGVIPSERSATPTGGSASTPTYSLFCNPYVKEVSLDSISGANGDQIVVMGPEANTSYTHNGTAWCTGEWTTVSTPLGNTKKYSLVAVESGTSIPARGFWYISKGGAPEITWPMVVE